ncbi:MAG: hypothetical protein ACI91O_000809 [Candidatus Poriferisodalaceae bacterium]|jgi:hypothetical protein
MRSTRRLLLSLAALALLAAACSRGQNRDEVAATPTTAAPTDTDATTPPTTAASLGGQAFDPAGDPVAQLNPTDPPPGTDPEFDALWVACAAEDADACEDLFFSSPVDSAYEAFGLTCGGRELTVCSTLFGGSSSSIAPGTNPALDIFWDQCAGGSASACDQLFLAADSDDAYFQFGLFCGDREPEICTVLLGDDGPPPILATWSPNDPAPGTDAALDALWASCANEDGQACYDLYHTSEIASAYERFGFTCGGREIADCGLLFGGDPVNASGAAGGDFNFTPSSPAPGTDATLDEL